MAKTPILVTLALSVFVVSLGALFGQENGPSGAYQSVSPHANAAERNPVDPFSDREIAPAAEVSRHAGSCGSGEHLQSPARCDNKGNTNVGLAHFRKNPAVSIHNACDPALPVNPISLPPRINVCCGLFRPRRMAAGWDNAPK